MQSELIKELLETMDSKLLLLIVQLVLCGAILMYLKELSTKILNFFKLKFSDFGRGTKLEIDGKIGYIKKVGFNEVELDIDEQSTMIIPVANFVKSNKIIHTNRGSQ